MQHGEQDGKVETYFNTVATTESAIHLVTQHGGHMTPNGDVIWAAPSRLPEELSRKLVGFASQTEVLARGPYDGGQTHKSFDTVVQKLRLVKLPKDELAVSPTMKIGLDAYDPALDGPSDKGAAAILVYEGEGLGFWNRTIRKPVQTDPETIKTMLPNVMPHERQPTPKPKVPKYKHGGNEA